MWAITLRLGCVEFLGPGSSAPGASAGSALRPRSAVWCPPHHGRFRVYQQLFGVVLNDLPLVTNSVLGASLHGVVPVTLFKNRLYSAPEHIQ